MSPHVNAYDYSVMSFSLYNETYLQLKKVVAFFHLPALCAWAGSKVPIPYKTTRKGKTPGTTDL